MHMLAHAGASHPNGFAHLLGAVERFVTTPVEIAIIGDPADERTKALRHEIATRLVPAAVTLTGSASDPSPLLSGREARGGAPTAYVCEHYACKQPVTDPRELRAQLDAVIGGRQQAAREEPAASASATAHPNPVIRPPRAASRVPTNDALV